MKKVYVKTYGCQMNVYDSEKMVDLLKPHGFSVADGVQDADMVILNTCHIREKAAEKVYSELGRIRQEKEKRKKRTGHDMLIAVAGCVAQAEGEEVIRRAPFVDIVVGPQSYHNLPVLLEQVKRTKKWALDLEFYEDAKFDKILSVNDNKQASAFLSIQEGCDKFCHFCVVPYTRGAEFSRPVSDIYREALKLAHSGTKEITLLGQNVNAYHGIGENTDTWSLAKLIKLLAEIDGLEQIRYTTSHPKDMMDEELLELHGSEAKLMPFLHLPVQSGSDKILKAMNRKHDRAFYLSIIEKLKSYRPDIAFSSDFIVGYPGETDKDFEDTLSLIKQVNYAQCYSFKYSMRPGTPAASLPNQVPESSKSERLQELQNLVNSQQLAFNEQMVGKTMQVLFSRTGKKEDQLIGKSQYMQSVVIEGDDTEQFLSKIVDVKITSASQSSLKGVL